MVKARGKPEFQLSNDATCSRKYRVEREIRGGLNFVIGTYYIFGGVCVLTPELLGILRMGHC